MPYSAIPNKPNFMILGIVREQNPHFSTVWRPTPHRSEYLYTNHLRPIYRVFSALSIGNFDDILISEVIKLWLNV